MHMINGITLILIHLAHFPFRDGDSPRNPSFGVYIQMYLILFALQEHEMLVTLVVVTNP